MLSKLSVTDYQTNSAGTWLQQLAQTKAQHGEVMCLALNFEFATNSFEGGCCFDYIIS